MAYPAFAEIDTSPQEEFGENGFAAQRTIRCGWDQRWSMVKAVLGDGYPFGGTTLNQYPGQPSAVAVRVRIKPFHDDQETVVGGPTDLETELSSFTKYAELTLNYETIEPTPWPLGELPARQAQTFLKYQADFGSSAAIIASRGVKWANGDVVSEHDQVTAMRIPTHIHHVSWHRVVNLPLAVIKTSVGTVNNAAFLGADPECLLFTGATIGREFSITHVGNVIAQAWRVDFYFKERLIDVPGLGQFGGWNHFYRATPPASRGWAKMFIQPANTPLYPLTTFTNLFTYP